MKSRGRERAAEPRKVVSRRFAWALAGALAALGPGAASAQGAIELSGPFTIAPEPYVHHQLLADFTGDSDPDLVTVSTSGPFASDSRLEIRRGLGGYGFAAPAVIDASGIPLTNGDLASADLNGDGNRDLVLTGGSSDLRAYAGDGSGGFAAPVGRDLEPGSGGDAVAIGHFDADSDPDVAVAQQGSQLVAIAFGHTGVSFQRPDERPQSFYYQDSVQMGQPNSLAVLDTNNDGRDDIVALDRSGGEVRTFRQHNPDCEDHSCRPFTNGNASDVDSGYERGNHVATGDFNGDGRGDLAVAGENGADSGVAVLAQNAGGGFGSPATYDIPLEFNRARIGIANQDLGLDPELIVTTGRGRFNSDSGSFEGANQFVILPGAAGATFGAPEAFAVGAPVGRIAVGQINGLNRVDFVVGGQGIHGFLNGPNELPPDTVITGGPSGQTNDASPSFRFQSRGLPSATSFECRVDSASEDDWMPCSNPFAAGELGEGDHTFDVRAIAPDNNIDPTPARRDFTVVIHEPVPAPVFASPPNFINAGGGDKSIASADFNEDGMPDIAVPDSNGSSVQVLLGNGVTFTTPPVELEAGQGPIAIVAGKLDADDHDDVATANLFAGTVSLMLGNGDGTFGPTKTLDVADDPRDIVAADLGQAGLDLLTTHPSEDVIDRIRYSGDEHEEAAEYTLGFGPSAVAVADLGGGPEGEMIIGGPNRIEVRWGQSSGQFFDTRATSVAGTPADLITGDFNGDGNADVAAAMGASDEVAVLLGDGERGFTFGVYTHPVGEDPRALTAADFNGDGVDDLAVANRDSDDFSILLGKGLGGFAAGVPFTTLLPGGTSGNSPAGIAAVDTNLDGRIDIVTANDADVTRIRNETDVTAPSLTLKGKRKQRAGKAKVRLAANESCTASVRTVVVLKKKGKRTTVKRPALTVELVAGKQRAVKLNPGSKAKRFLKRGKGSAVLKVTARCTDAADHTSDAVRRKVKLRR